MMFSGKLVIAEPLQNKEWSLITLKLGVPAKVGNKILFSEKFKPWDLP